MAHSNMFETSLRFQVLEEEELLDFFSSTFPLNIPFDKFIKPTKEMVCNIYEKFLKELGVENWQMAQLRAAETDNMAMNSNSFAQINLMKQIQWFLEKTGFRDFGFPDLFAPKRKRNKVIFSQLLGLCAAKYELETMWANESVKYEMIPVKKANLIKQIDDQKRSIEYKICELSRLKDEMEAPIREIARLAELVEAERQKGCKLKTSQEEMKKLVSGVREANAEADQEIALLKEEIDGLERQIVKSPEKVLMEIERKNAERDERRAEKQQKEKLYMDRVNRMNILTEALEDTKRHKKALKESYDHVVALKQACTNLKELEESITQRDKKIAQLNAQLEILQLSKEDISKQKASISKQHEKRTLTLRGMIEEMEKKLDQMIQERIKLDKAAAEEEQYLMQQIEKLKTMREAQKKDFQEFQKEHMEKFVQTTKPIADKVSKVLAKFPRK